MGTLFSARNNRVCFLLCALAAGTVLVGWRFNIAVLMNGFAGPSTMKINTALGLICLAMAGFFASFQPARGSAHFRLSQGLAVLAIVLAVAILSEYATGKNLGLDEFFKPDLGSRGSRWPPGRPSVVTCILFLLVGSTILGLPSRIEFIKKTAHALLLIALTLSFQAVLSYLEGVNSSFGLALFTQVAVHTALIFTLICVGLVVNRPQEGLMRIIASQTAAGRIGKILLFFALFLPPTIAWLQLAGESRGWWNSETGSVLRIISQIVFFSWVAFKVGSSLLASEARERAQQESLQRAVRSRDEFLSIASHELRTPITSMKLQAQTLQRRLRKSNFSASEDLDLSAWMERSDRGLNRMARLVDDMLDISRIDHGRLKLQPQTVSLRALLTETFGRFAQPLRDAGIELSLVVAEDTSLWIDVFRMEQVFANLITNVIKYAPKAPLKVKSLLRSASIEIVIQDQGPGIAPESRQRIFERFERLISANEVSGLGLGLFISRKIIETHGGTIEARTPEGRGAQFVISLPRTP